jgi:biotin carboxylase
MKAAGLPTPANYLIRSSADIKAAAQTVGFPAVIKPISGAASEGVVRVDSLEQLEKCAAHSHRLDSALYKHSVAVESPLLCQRSSLGGSLWFSMATLLW